MYEHFKAVQDVGSPVIIYNIPPRSVVDMTPETMAELAKLPNIVGVKDATCDLGRPQLTRSIMVEDLDFCFLSGEDGTAVPFLAAGGSDKEARSYVEGEFPKGTIKIIKKAMGLNKKK